eukprot:853494-Pleurochrysis_carterae.AAC.1
MSRPLPGIFAPRTARYARRRSRTACSARRTPRATPAPAPTAPRCHPPHAGAAHATARAQASQRVVKGR